MSIGLLALLDDIVSVLDDVAAMTKVAAKKTVGVLGDDLALNAEQVTGVRMAREIPVVLAVARGSLINKLILVPAAIFISIFIPWLVIPLLMLGGAYLCFEGAEKVLHSIFSKKTGSGFSQGECAKTSADDDEKSKITGAIRTDFILSAEIIVISLGVVSEKSLLTQVAVLSIIAVAMTVGVYGLVAGIVKIDDLGLWIYKRSQAKTLKRRVGTWLIKFTPYLMRFLGVIGTLAMFLVGGGIIVHGIPILAQFLAHFASKLTHMGYWQFAVDLVQSVLNGGIGLILGVVLVWFVTMGTKAYCKVISDK